MRTTNTPRFRLYRDNMGKSNRFVRAALEQLVLSQEVLDEQIKILEESLQELKIQRDYLIDVKGNMLIAIEEGERNEN